MKHGMKKKLKQVTACSLVSAIVFAAPVYAETLNNDGLFNTQNTGTAASQTSNATNTNAPVQQVRLGFPDVPSIHWAIKHISKLTLLGIVQGDDLGRYNPENQVSQQDAVIMAIRMMGLEREALEGSAAIGPLQVRDDAKPYVAKAFEKGLLDLQEEFEGSANWGSRNASREWVAKIVIRAIGKKQDALAKASIPTEFADNAQLSSSSVGYINEAVSLGIVNGFEDRTFRPEGNVTRAQMATFLSRAEKYLNAPSDKVVSGTVMSYESGKLIVRNKKGDHVTLQLNANASFYSSKNDTTRLLPSDVKLYNEVYVIQNQGTAYLVEVTNDEVPMQTIPGKLVNVGISDLTISIESDGKFNTYDLAPNVQIVDESGNGLTQLSSLAEHSVVELRKHAIISNAKISQIIVKQVPVNKTVDGSYQSVDLKGLTITVKDKNTGLSESYEITDKSVFMQGDAYFDPALLYEGDIVRLEVKNSKVVSVQVIKQQVELRDQGKLEYISEDRTSLQIQKSGDKLAAYKLSANVQVVMEGNMFATVKDLMPGDELKLEINGNRIDKITVVSRSIENYAMATILSYEPDRKILTVIDELGLPNSYILTDKTRLLYDETEVPYNSFQSIFVKGKRVNLVVSQKSLISVQIATKVEGTVAQVNSAANEITVKTASGTIQTYKMLAGVIVDKYSKSGAKLSDVKVGDYVRGLFDGTQQNLMTLAVRDTLLFRTISKDAAANRITVRESGTTSSSLLLNGIPIIRNGQQAALADIAVDEPIQLTFIGKTLEGVQIVESSRGIVTAVDAASGKITVTDYANGSRTIDAGVSVTVNNGQNVATSLASVQVNDRIELVKGTNGNTVVTVIAGQQRTIDSYNFSTKELTFKRRTLSDTTNYPLHEKVYVHQGAQLMVPASLVSNDIVTLYFINDKIVEIAKQ